MKHLYTIPSEYDKLSLSVMAITPDRNAKGIVQISHGMAEYKERYEPFMQFLSDNGYIAVIHDHRGHGKSVKNKDDLGFFYSGDIESVINDLYNVTEFAKNQFGNLPLYMFSHSMGTLIARNYIKTHDDELEKLILCGPPTVNNAVDWGLLLIKMSTLLRGQRHRSNFINNLTIGIFNKDFKDGEENEWICSDMNQVKKYNADELCGFTFTNNGFNILLKLQKEAFSATGWGLKNPSLPIMIIAGKEDKVIQSEEKFRELKEFLNSKGYRNVKTRLYDDKRHELLNETGKESIYNDVLRFIESN